MKWLRYWWPALIWALVISGFSTGIFTSTNSSHYIIPILRFFLPHTSAETLDFLHHIIRKCGHLTEYFILSMLILRGIRAGEKGLYLRWALVTILIVACYAALDEYHQSFVPGRTAAVGDVLIDTSGGVAAQIVASLFVLLGKAREMRHKDEKNAAGTIPTNTA
ncbi:MAG TPA: VanZ family protein [Candidatus Acidoferrales bacterium]